MNTITSTERYARVIEVSKRVRWEIERDVIRGRRFDYTKTFMPSGLSLVNELAFLSPADKRLFSQVQGRTYAYLFALVERFISAKVLDISREHWLGDQVALEALVRMSDEEIKHQEMFRRLEAQMTQDMPPGYVQTADANAVARAVLGKSTWAVLALTLDIELFVQAHYRASIAPAGRPVRAVEGRLPVPLEGRVAARHPRRDGADQGRRASWTPPSAQPPWTT